MDEASEQAQHPAITLGNALGEVTDMYTKRSKHTIVTTIPPIDMPIVAESPNAFRVSSGVPV
jgi:selenophosphate synthase